MCPTRFCVRGVSPGAASRWGIVLTGLTEEQQAALTKIKVGTNGALCSKAIEWLELLFTRGIRSGYFENKRTISRSGDVFLSATVASDSPVSNLRMYRFRAASAGDSSLLYVPSSQWMVWRSRLRRVRRRQDIEFERSCERAVRGFGFWYAGKIQSVMIARENDLSYA